MVIDINNNFSSNAASASRNRANAPATGKESPAPAETIPAKSGKDQVVISEQAQGLRKLQTSIGNLPDVDSDRVNALRQAIAEGKFEINADRIAENMLNQEALLR